MTTDKLVARTIVASGPVMLDILSSVDFWKFALPLLGAVFAWYANEWRKRITEQYQRKEASYKELVRSLRGFYVGAADAEAHMLEFINQLNMAWLYCPDDVIKKGYAFLDTIRDSQPDAVKEAAVGEFVLALRQDLLSRKLLKATSLQTTDFRHFDTA